MRTNFLRFIGAFTVLLIATGGAHGHGAATAHAGGGCRGDSETKETSGTGTEVNIRGCAFLPTALQVQPDTRVVFRNVDQGPHVVIGQSWLVPGQMEATTVGAVEFRREGTFPYACTLHPGMVGVIIVGDGVGDATSQVQASVRTTTERSPAPPVASPVPAIVQPVADSGWPRVGWAGTGAVLGIALTAVAFGFARERQRGI